MTVILGQVFHRPDRKGEQLIFIDCDNQKGIQEICKILGVIMSKPYDSIQQLAEDFLVEQHEDDMTRAHIYFYARKTLRNKSSNKNNPILSPQLNDNEIPSLEIKSDRAIAYCAPSFHIHGHRYQIIGTLEPPTLDEGQIDGLQNGIKTLCALYGIEYDEYASVSTNNRYNPNSSNERTLASKLWQENTTVYRGHNRHGAMLSLMDSLLIKFPNESEDFSLKIAEIKNQQMCKDENGNPAPLSENEMRSLLKQAKSFSVRKLEEREHQHRDKENSAEQTTKEKQPQQRSNNSGARIEEKETRPQHQIQKFSSDNILAEAVLINGTPSFLIATNDGSIEIKRSIELEDKILIPPDYDTYINKPYSFLSDEHVKSLIENVRKENLDSLYKRIKSIWGKYVDADDFHLSLCAADTIYTYFQDKIGLTHYLFFVGNVGSGKSNNLRIFQ